MALKFPLLTERLRIRPLRLDDAVALLGVYGDVETMQFLTANVPTTLDEAQAWVQSKIDLFAADGGLSLWAVELCETGEVIGDVGLQYEDYGWDSRHVGIGGRGLRTLWRHGLGAEAAQACLRAGFDDLGLEQICAETATNNRAAQKLLLSRGFREIGRNRDGWPVFAISRAEWLAAQAS